MKHLRPPLLFFAALLAILAGGCAKNDASSQWIDPAKISQGPIVHAKLSEEQLARISRLQKTFAEVDPTPLEKWIEDFSRDQDPDREIKIWEGMAQPFEAFTAKHTLTPQGKKEAFQVVMLRSGASESETLSHLKLQVLTEADAKEILAAYREAPEPIRVYSK